MQQFTESNFQLKEEATIKKGKRLKNASTELNITTPFDNNNQFYQKLEIQMEYESIHSTHQQNRRINCKQQISLLCSSQEDIEDKNQAPEIQWSISQFKQLNKNNDLSEKFLNSQDLIFSRLKDQQCYISKYLASGGEGEIFEGFIVYSKDEIIKVVFKIIFGYVQKQIDDEIKIMRAFEKNITTVNLIDYFAISNDIYCFVLEKCQHSLKEELTLVLNHKKKLPFEKLIRMILDLLDGLIQFRIYNILHLDIKPQNILISNDGYCVFTDFGMSSLRNDNKIVINKGYTPKYAALEQKSNKGYSIDYCTDIYSLSLTIQELIDAFKVNKDEYQENIQIISSFESLIKKIIIEKQPQKRLSCEHLHNNFLRILIENNQYQILLKYQKNIRRINFLDQFDENKDMLYFINLKYYYRKIDLKIWNFVQENSKSLVLTQSDLQSLIIDPQQIQLNLEYFNYGNLYYLEIGKYYMILKNIYSQQIRRKQCNKFAINNTQRISKRLEEFDNFESSLDMFEFSLYFREQNYGKNHIEVGKQFDSLGSFYIENGYEENRLEYLINALDIKKFTDFKVHPPFIAYLFEQIGFQLINKGDYTNGFQYIEKTLCIRNNFPNYRYTEFGLYFDSLFDIFLSVDNKIYTYLMSLELFEGIYKRDHPVIGNILAKIGIYYCEYGDYYIGLEYLLESQCIFQNHFENNHFLNLFIARQIEQYQSVLRKYKDGKSIFIQVKDCVILSEKDLIDYPEISLQVSFFYQRIKKYEKALRYIITVLNVSIQQEQINEVRIRKAFFQIYYCYQQMSDFPKIIEYLLQFLNIVKEKYKENLELKRIIYNNIGYYYFRLGDIDKAIYYLQCSLNIWNLNQQNNLWITVTLNTLGECYLILNENKSAERCFLDSLSSRKKIFKGSHWRVQAVLDNLGICYFQMNDFDKAIKYQIESLSMIKEIHPMNHVDIATSLNNLGVSFFQIEQPEKALSFLLESLYMLKQLYKNKNHPFIISCLNNVGLCYKKLGCLKQFLQCGVQMYQIMSKPIQDHNYIYKSHCRQVKDLTLFHTVV